MAMRRTLRTSVGAMASVVLAASLTCAATASHAMSQRVTNVRSLRAFTHRLHARSASALPASVAEIVTQMDANPATGQEPIKGSPSIYIFKRDNSELCTVLVVMHAGGSCDSVLRDAGGSLRAQEAIVDGKMFVWGLAANDVAGVTVSLAATATTPGASERPASLANNTFVVALPYRGGWLGQGDYRGLTSPRLN